MSVISRESIMNALLARIATTADFKTTGRRNRSPETIKPGDSPALFLVGHSELYDHQGAGMPPNRTLVVKAAFYNNIGADQAAVPETAINNALDQLDVIMRPDEFASGRSTLGGLVYQAWIEGRPAIIKSAGDITGASAAIVTINLILP